MSLQNRLPTLQLHRSISDPAWLVFFDAFCSYCGLTLHFVEDGRNNPLQNPGNEKPCRRGMDIKLSEESARKLLRLPEIELWDVAPTMVRGSHGHKPGKDLSKKQLVWNSGKGGSKKTLEQKASRKRKARVLFADSMAPDKEDEKVCIRRNVEGRKTIREMMTNLHATDCSKFGNAPMFDSEGLCRMRLDGAKKVSREEILEAAPGCFDHMCLGEDFLGRGWATLYIPL